MACVGKKVLVGKRQRSPFERCHSRGKCWILGACRVYIRSRGRCVGRGGGDVERPMTNTAGSPWTVHVGRDGVAGGRDGGMKWKGGRERTMDACEREDETRGVVMQGGREGG